ncbi:unnamed protein product [Alternaria alternata]|jgi:hypothetical protein
MSPHSIFANHDIKTTAKTVPAPMTLYQCIPTFAPELADPGVGAIRTSDDETLDVADFVSVANTDEIAVTEEVLSVSPKDTIPMDVRPKSLPHV